jgi:hypothetical protein
MALPSSLARDISPPRPLKRRKLFGTTTLNRLTDTKPKTLSNIAPIAAIPDIEPTLAAVEAGKAKIDDHLAYFKAHLAKASRHTQPDVPRLSIPSFASLYQSNSHPHGHHFVIHQHNHPIAGVHYDLRLQFSETSSLSFAIPKGLPGNADSRSIGRLAIETRVHNNWNHLIESASVKTGSLLIWDTGTYSILPRSKKGKNGMPSPQTPDDEGDDSGEEKEITGRMGAGVQQEKHDNEKLVEAFQTRYIRLRLHGTRLPKNYTIILRLSSTEIVKRPTARRKRRRKTCELPAPFKDSDDEQKEVPVSIDEQAEQDIDTDTDEDTTTCLTNAYPGSTNSIGSIHQRHWFIQLDRQNSGFELDKSGGGKGKWNGGFTPFLVLGRDHERSIITGRLARDVESDEGVEGFVGRGGWTPITR